MKSRKKVMIFFLILQFMFQLLVISSIFLPKEKNQNFLAPNNISFIFSNYVPSPYYNNFFNKYNWEFDPTYAPLQILTVIHYDENSNLDDFAYLSAIPIAIFNDSGIRKIITNNI